MSLNLPTGFEPPWNLTIDTPSYWEHLDTTYHWRINFARRNLYCGHSSLEKKAPTTQQVRRPRCPAQPSSRPAWPWSQTITKNDQRSDKTTPSSSGPTHCFHTDSPAVSTGKLLLYPHGWCFGEFRIQHVFYGLRDEGDVDCVFSWCLIVVVRLQAHTLLSHE